MIGSLSLHRAVWLFEDERNDEEGERNWGWKRRPCLTRPRNQGQIRGRHQHSREAEKTLGRRPGYLERGEQGEQGLFLLTLGWTLRTTRIARKGTRGMKGGEGVVVVAWGLVFGRGGWVGGCRSRLWSLAGGNWPRQRY